MKGEFRIEFEFEESAQIKPVTEALEDLLNTATSIQVTRLVVGHEMPTAGYLREVRK